jgi:hypothetical protein
VAAEPEAADEPTATPSDTATGDEPVADETTTEA